MTNFTHSNVVKWLNEQAVLKRVDARIADRLKNRHKLNAQADAYEFAAKQIGDMLPMPRETKCPQCGEEIL